MEQGIAQPRPGIPQRFCANHPARPAIGVCVVTAMPICGECSTRYEGVNYSKEGLRLLRERRAAAAGGKRPLRERAVTLAAWCASPVLLYLVYLSYDQSARALIDLLHWDR